MLGAGWGADHQPPVGDLDVDVVPVYAWKVQVDDVGVVGYVVPRPNSLIRSG
jgi:hypothetical protein